MNRRIRALQAPALPDLATPPEKQLKVLGPKLNVKRQIIEKIVPEKSKVKSKSNGQSRRNNEELRKEYFGFPNRFFSSQMHKLTTLDGPRLFPIPGQLTDLPPTFELVSVLTFYISISLSGFLRLPTF